MGVRQCAADGCNALEFRTTGWCWRHKSLDEPLPSVDLSLTNQVEQNSQDEYRQNDQDLEFTDESNNSSPGIHIPIFSNDGNYSGEAENNLAHGKGKYIWPDGDIYEGEFKYGKCNGYGKWTYSDGSIYKGENKDGLFLNGKYTFSDGSIYEGEFKNQLFHGIGVHTWPDGQIYKGEYKDGEWHGNGKLNLPNGEVYEGEYKDGIFLSAPQAESINSENQGGMNWEFIIYILKGLFKFLWWLSSDWESTPQTNVNHGRITQNFVCTRGHVVTANLSNTPSKCSICDSPLRRQL